MAPIRDYTPRRETMSTELLWFAYDFGQCSRRGCCVSVRHSQQARRPHRSDLLWRVRLTTFGSCDAGPARFFANSLEGATQIRVN